ncbi:MAG TPA: hypothetical protein PLX20_05400 [Rhodocyclaceae bacterium]|nr:hypothetical protein [Rhodocyclaceae bacterium]HNB79237.1 hypothetical protein [Rhodocyclaceae bacterium]HNH12546.1 hypothetical protein [Rhodocyclaceae bacterium]HNI00272.1 hypothetical protein [Rhodocyclaceae bacterium]
MSRPTRMPNVGQRRAPDVSFVASLAWAHGQCRNCGCCGKAFTVARKPYDYGEWTDLALPGVGVVYLVCRKCGQRSRAEQLAVVARDYRPLLERFYLTKATAAGRA